MTDGPWTPLAAEEWDAAVLAEEGHFLQSWRWGEFKARFGWSVERVSVAGKSGSGLAQVLFQARGPVSVGYVPRGPVLPAGDPALASELMRYIDITSKSKHALYTLIEPDRELPFDGRYKQRGFVCGPDHIQPARTVKVSLLDDDALLAQMKQNNRYYIRLAIRRGVQVARRGEGYDVADFYGLLRETSDRNDFAVHDERYYREFLDTFGDDAICLFGHSDGNLAAAVIAARHGAEGIYMYGASSARHRAHGAAFLLQFEAMKWARDAGCEHYDLWGIPLHDPDTMGDSDDSVARSKGDDWRGLHRFKTGFGGEIVSYPPVLERRYSRIGSLIARRVTRRKRGDT